MKNKQVVLGGILAAALAFSIGTSAFAMENKDVYFGGEIKVDTSDFAGMIVRGTLSEMPSTTPPTTITISSGGKTYLVNVTTSTKIVRKYNGKSTLDEFVVGDTVEAMGTVNADGSIQAKRLKNYSIYLTTHRGTNGTIKSIDLATNSFVSTWKGKDYTVYVDSKTKIVIPTIDNTAELADLKVGDAIRGRAVFNSRDSHTTAKTVLVLRRDGVNLVKAKTTKLEGRITEIASTTLPTTITVKKGDKTTTVNVTDKTVLVRKHFGLSNLSEFAVGDKVYVIGTKNATDPTIVDAKFIKDDSLKSLSDRKVDTDQDGIPDVRDEKPNDHDNDGTDDATDPDDDNDGTRDSLERSILRFDHDNDGAKDNKDKDDDNDGVKDEKEATGKEDDHDNDGTDDATDPDDDNDGIADSAELDKAYDHDNDGKRDDRDEDDDDDGVKDESEESGKQFDHDNDGTDDATDDDDDGDSIKDTDEAEGQAWDSDNDGVEDKDEEENKD